MKNVLLVSVVVMSACGGNWSNRDLEFVSALPSRAALKSSLPIDPSQGLSSVGTRHDGLGVGDPSVAYQDTKGAVTTFNGILDFLLAVVDTVRTLPPTTRTSDTRTWGPWADSKNKGFEFELTIAQTGDHTFSWAIRSRKDGGAFFDVVLGDFTSSSTASQGVGALHVPVKSFRDQLPVDSNIAKVDQLDIGYFSEAWPHRVEMAFAIAPGVDLPISSIGYSFLEQQDHSGRAVFAVKNVDPDKLAYTAVSFWLPTGAGRSAVHVDQGAWAGDTLQECWDTNFKVTYHLDRTQTVGNPADCVTVPGL